MFSACNTHYHAHIVNGVIKNFVFKAKDLQEKDKDKDFEPRSRQKKLKAKTTATITSITGFGNVKS